jgi:uncharacterized membrane protein YkoI
MTKHLSLVIAAAAAAFATAAPADAKPRSRDQDAAFEATQQGRIMPLRTIEAKILPRMGGADYLGPELDAASSRYRLKFLRGDRVIWIDVDGRTGRVIGKSGN